MSASSRGAIPILFVVTLLAVAGCEREPPAEFVEEVEMLRTERERMQDELAEAQTTLRDLRAELREMEIPEDALDRPLRSAPDTLRAILQGSAERVATARNELQRMQVQAQSQRRRADSLQASMDDRTAELQAALDDERTRAAELEERADRLAAQGDRLEDEVERLSDAVQALETEANRVFWVVGTEDELRERGVLEAEGGARFLFVLWRRGEALVPARGPDPAAFNQADRLEALEIPLPRDDVRYRVVSRQDLEYADAEEVGEGWIRGASLRVTDPEAFWQASRFLILVDSGS